LPTTTCKSKWIDQQLEDAMDGVEKVYTSLKKLSSIGTSLLPHSRITSMGELGARKWVIKVC